MVQTGVFRNKSISLPGFLVYCFCDAEELSRVQNPSGLTYRILKALDKLR